MLKDYLKIKKMTVTELSRKSEIPYSTLHELINGVTDYKKCSVETFKKVAEALDLTMDELFTLWNSYSFDIQDFELFKSNVCHNLKEFGDLNFLEKTISGTEIESYWSAKMYPEAFYLLAMTDYICNKYEIPLYSKYSDLRTMKLAVLLYPLSAYITSKIEPQQVVFESYTNNAIPEFLKYNIVEKDIYDIA